MTLAQVVPILLQASVGAIVFALGLEAAPGGVTHLLRRPSLLVRSLLAMLVIMPLFVAVVAALFHLRPEVEVALLLLAVSPVPPVLPGKQAKAGGHLSYAIGLLAVSATLAIVSAPLTVQGIASMFGQEVQVPVPVVGRTIAVTLLAPLLAGMLVRRLAPALAQRFASGISTAGFALLVLAIIPVFVAAWPAVLAQASAFSLLAIVAFVLVGLAVGHVLGGPAEDERTVLALSTSTRHPGVALTIAGAILAEQRPIAAVVLLVLVVGAIVTLPYSKWRARVTPPAAAA